MSCLALTLLVTSYIPIELELTVIRTVELIDEFNTNHTVHIVTLVNFRGAHKNKIIQN